MRRTAILLFLSMLPGLSLSAQTAYSVQSDGDDKLYSIDLHTGVAKAIGATGFGDIESLTFSPGCDTLYGVDDVTDVLVKCDIATGACEEIGKLGYDVTDTGLAVASNGRYYMSTDVPTPETLFSIDPASGSATKVGPQGFHVTGLAGRRKDLASKCPSGLFGLEGDTPRGKASQLLCLDLGTGAAHAIGPLKALTITDGGLDFTLDGTLYGISDGLQAANDPSRIFTADPDTGEAHVVATVKVNNRPAFGFEGLAIADGICDGVIDERQSVLEVPALDGWGLAGLGLLLAAAGAVVLRRRAA
ncbi:MAG TPA: IPTL-CTERM sorting domain-containing protein [Thermoanaerobaculia bacterium]|nr:IPTL-CTERM sorting domain-containing protein [Thermoanaerobaculia bacterium]